VVLELRWRASNDLVMNFGWFAEDQVATARL